MILKERRTFGLLLGWLRAGSVHEIRAANYTKIKCMNNSNGCCGLSSPKWTKWTTSWGLQLIRGGAQQFVVCSCFVFTLHFIALTL